MLTSFFQHMITTRYQKKNDINNLRRIVIDKMHWQFIKDNHYTKIIALENGKIIGVTALTITLGTANLDFIFVHKEKRTRGAGEQLMIHAEKWAQNKKANGLGVNCSQENKNATRFYLHQGFKQTGKVYNYFSKNTWQLFFWKKI